MTLRKIILGTVAALLLVVGPVHAACVDLRDDSHKVTVRGTIEQSTTTEEGEGGTPPGRKYMSIVLDQPGCAANDEKSIAVDPVSVKWLGHHVAITGTVEPTGEGPYIAVQHIVEDAPRGAEEETTDDGMSNWVETLYVITVMNQHGYRSSFYYAEPAAAHKIKPDCEAELKKVLPKEHDAECTPFRANMGPISALYFCRGCTPEQAEEAIKPYRGRVVVENQHGWVIVSPLDGHVFSDKSACEKAAGLVHSRAENFYCAPY
jgi:hypothetical protein